MTKTDGEWEYRIRINGLTSAIAWGLFFAFWLLVVSSAIAGGLFFVLFASLVSGQGG